MRSVPSIDSSRSSAVGRRRRRRARSSARAGGRKPSALRKRRRRPSAGYRPARNGASSLTSGVKSHFVPWAWAGGDGTLAAQAEAVSALLRVLVLRRSAVSGSSAARSSTLVGPSSVVATGVGVATGSGRRTSSTTTSRCGPAVSKQNPKVSPIPNAITPSTAPRSPTTPSMPRSRDQFDVLKKSAGWPPGAPSRPRAGRAGSRARRRPRRAAASPTSSSPRGSGTGPSSAPPRRSGRRSPSTSLPCRLPSVWRARSGSLRPPRR